MKTRSIAMMSAGLMLIGSVTVLSLTRPDDSQPPDADPPERATATAGSLAMTMRFDESVVLTGDNGSVALVEVTASSDATTQRTPVAMAIVLDTSGSMSGNKISNAREAAHQLVDRLSEGDVLTLVRFDSHAVTVLDNLLVTADRTAAHAAVAGLSATGGTCMRCGLEQAYQSLESAPSDHQRRVILLSDGIDESNASDGELMRLASQALELRYTPTATIGLGRDVSESTMRAIAEGGTGTYYFMHNSQMIADILGTELQALENTAVSGLTLEIVPAAGVIIDDTQIVGSRRDGATLIVPLGQMTAGERRLFVVPITLPASELGEVLSARAVFSDAEGASHEISIAGSLIRSNDQAAVVASRSLEVREEVARRDSADEIERAIQHWERGEREAAVRILQDNAGVLSTLADESGSEVVAQEEAQVRNFMDVVQSAPAGSATQAGSAGFNYGRINSIRRGDAPERDREIYWNDDNDFAQTE